MSGLSKITKDLGTTIEYIVTKRQGNLDYLKRVHQGDVHWLNVVKLSKDSITKHLRPEKLSRRTLHWFILGLSAGRLLELESGTRVVRALTQLIEEYEYFISSGEGSGDTGGGSGGGANGYNFHTSARLYAMRLGRDKAQGYSDHEPVRASIVKSGRTVQYQYLQTPFTCLPAGQMDYCQVVYSLCDVLSLVYAKFLDEECGHSHMHDAIVKADKKIKQLIIAKMAQDLTAVATPLLKGELRNLLSHTFVDKAKSNPVKTTFINLMPKEEQEENDSAGTATGADSNNGNGKQEDDD